MRDSKYDDEVIMDALGLTKAEMDVILCIAEVPVEIDLSMNFGVASQETIQEAVNEEDNGEEGVEETQIGVLKSESEIEEKKRVDSFISLAPSWKNPNPQYTIL
ncbi:hypothetical protein L2E82_12003 [Cichorium intybus]|uniref:Uncharacterized protein n=1 Tax=Cichorium intybus TaxID=13427 RepID=A0ACB9GFX2_CICIN|nr:hypothetical protein L2E82_12003 [Cichorium intybus]